MYKRLLLNVSMIEAEATELNLYMETRVKK